MKVPAGKAVLHLGDEQAGANSRVLKIDSEATGITTTNYTNFTNGDWYNLQGRKVNKAVKGVYIMNGRKVVVK